MDDAMKAKLKPIFSMAIMKKEKPMDNIDNADSTDESSFEEQGMKTASEEILTAIEQKDAEALEEALCSFLEMYEKEEENESPEEETKEDEEMKSPSSEPVK